MAVNSRSASLEQPCGEREPAVEVGDVRGRDRALVAHVVLELGPRVLEDRAHLHRGGAPAKVCVCRVAGLVVERHQQVAGGVAEASLLRRLLAEVPVVEDAELPASRSATAVTSPWR